ncbi:hypoxanthine phosphoribosyltransferase [uncultured Desulfovibrio sp.]|uniref:hypoxanthine phosphoribosyltransferase n=1 Tax=uncultured Desulfovibrio sp. TaxID=167968 RepID=UPI0026050D6B|nr:hypoxanthine phosphoribosyltransferase [uncultured Desulfovibrio sp.]
MTAKLLFSAEDIAARVAELGEEISAAYTGEPLVAVCVLKGAVHFFSDLTRAIRREDLEMDFIRISSYGMGTETSRQIRLTKDLECDVRGKHVLVVEDVVDSGHSLRFLLDLLADRGARSVRIATLVNKTERREVDIPVAFSGFMLDSGFIVGYGLDHAERYRALPSIYELLSV